MRPEPSVPKSGSSWMQVAAAFLVLAALNSTVPADYLCFCNLSIRKNIMLLYVQCYNFLNEFGHFESDCKLPKSEHILLSCLCF